MFGGHDGEGDIDSCEQYSIRENVWRQISSMNFKRNGASVVTLDKIIFVFGGNNQTNGSMDTIERYNIEFDRWTILQLHLREPVHDSVAFPVGGRRVLIFGGSLSDGSPNTYWQIYDLTSECLNAGEEKVIFEGGKVYLPPVYDPEEDNLHYFSGYGDSVLTHGQIPTLQMICHCHPGMNSVGYRVHEPSNYINVKELPPLNRLGSSGSTRNNLSRQLSQGAGLMATGNSIISGNSQRDGAFQMNVFTPDKYGKKQ